MQNPTTAIQRRQILGLGAMAGLVSYLGTQPVFGEVEATSPQFAFYVAGDTHYLADKENPSQMNMASSKICGSLVDALNALPGQQIPAEAGGGRVAAPLGLIHVGDVIDTGDKQGGVSGEMQKTEWSAFTDDYGLNGKDGRLKFPVYEICGNHDAPHGVGLALNKIVERNRSRPGLVNVSKNELHYSWDWEGVHFLNLGLIVGTDKTVDRPRRYAAMDSLEFLISDLNEKVADSGRPIIISHHIDIARYTGPCEADARPGKEWDACDVRGFHQALQGYNVAAIFYGHTHARNVFQWDGLSAKAEAGIHVFNSDNGSHFGSDSQAVYYVEKHAKQLIVREYQTRDRWQTGSFTPQCWVAAIR